VFARSPGTRVLHGFQFAIISHIAEDDESHKNKKTKAHKTGNPTDIRPDFEAADEIIERGDSSVHKRAVWY
jgi:type IV pilus biogenesis protein CpaD/CtpE